jgi:hypothetical protein
VSHGTVLPDGRGMLGNRRHEQQSNTVMPLGVTNYSQKIFDKKLPDNAEHHDSRLRRKKRESEPQILGGDRVERKARGRPRVSSRDETATGCECVNFLFCPLNIKLL